jgi:hypothetical protein
MDEMSGMLLHQLSLAASTQVDEEFGPLRYLRPFDGSEDAGIDVALMVKTVG